jgi:hypothetical protein
MIAANDERAVSSKEGAFQVKNSTNRETNYIKQIQNLKTGAALPFILHPLTIKKLREQHGFSSTDIKEIEDFIFRDVEKMRDYKIVARAPAQLCRQLGEMGARDDNTGFVLRSRTQIMGGSMQ